MKNKYIIFLLLCNLLTTISSSADSSTSCTNNNDESSCNSATGCYWDNQWGFCETCSAGYYCVNGNSNSCANNSISNSSATTCTSCPAKYTHQSHQYCTATKGDTTYNCTITNNTTPFKKGTSWDSTASNCPCMPGTYWSNGTCNTCETNSVSCGQNSNTNPTICLSCPNGYSTNDNITCINNSNQNQKCIMVYSNQDFKFKLKKCTDSSCTNTTDTDCGVCEDYQYKQLNSCRNCEPQGYYCDGTTITACPFGWTNSATDYTQRIGCSSCNTKITTSTNITVTDNYNNNSTNLQNITLSYYGTCDSN